MKSLRFDPFLLAAVLVLACLGTVIIYSSSAAYAEARDLPQTFYLVNHLKKLIIGFVALVLGLVVDYRRWERLARPMMLGSIALLLFLVASSAVGQVNGAKRWISFASFGLQPSELAKISLIFFLARFLSERAEGMRDLKTGFLAALPVAGFTFLLILKQPNYSTAATVACITAAMLFAGGCRLGHMLGLGAVALPALGALMVSSPYRMKRVMAFLNPDENLASSYQSLQALVSLGNGGLLGTGLGTSTQKLGYLPMPFTDTIFSILGEELGFLGSSICLMLFALVVWRGLRASHGAPESFGGLAALGISVSVAVNVIMHVGVCAKFFPTTGQPLPLVSYGGTNLCTALFAMGVLLNISGSRDAAPSAPLPAREPRRSLRGTMRRKPRLGVAA